MIRKFRVTATYQGTPALLVADSPFEFTTPTPEHAFHAVLNRMLPRSPGTREADWNITVVELERE